MATRFGAVSPAQAFATKMRWLVACLFVIILLLFGTIVALVRSSDNPELPMGDPAAVTASIPSNSSSTSVDILMANQRIEEGMIIQDAMLTVQSIHPDRMPEGAALASERQQVVGKYAGSLIRPNVPIMREDVTATPPMSSLKIPAGFRAVTITVDKRAVVEGWARPGSRVDVLFTYKEGAEMKVATIVRFTKILSVEGMASTDPNQPKAAITKDTTVTLLVTEKDAKKIELARNVGTLSLSLVGNDAVESTQEQSADVMDIGTILGTKNPDMVGEEPVQGRMYAKDPRTGRQVLYVLKNGRWVQDTGTNQQQ